MEHRARLHLHVLEPPEADRLVGGDVAGVADHAQPDRQRAVGLGEQRGEHVEHAPGGAEQILVARDPLLVGHQPRRSFRAAEDVVDDVAWDEQHHVAERPGGVAVLLPRVEHSGDDLAGREPRVVERLVTLAHDRRALRSLAAPQAWADRRIGRQRGGLRTVFGVCVGDLFGVVGLLVGRLCMARYDDEQRQNSPQQCLPPTVTWRSTGAGEGWKLQPQTAQLPLGVRHPSLASVARVGHRVARVVRRVLIGRRGDHDGVDRLHVHATRVAVGDVAGEDARLRRAPAPHPQAEAALADHLAAPVGAAADVLEIASAEVDARPLVVAHGLPPAELARAIELHLVEHAVVRRADHHQVGLRVRRVGEEHVVRHVLLRRHADDEVHVAVAAGVAHLAPLRARHVVEQQERMILVLALHHEGLVGDELHDLPLLQRGRTADVGGVGQLGVVDRADDAPDPRLTGARTVLHGDVLAAERLHRGDHLLAVIAVGDAKRRAHARLARHQADGLVARDDAAGELRVLGDLRLLTREQRERHRLVGPTRGDTATALEGVDRHHGDGGVVLGGDEVHRWPTQILLVGVDRDVVGVPRAGGEQQRGAGDGHAAPAEGVDLVGDDRDVGGDVVAAMV